MNDTSYKGEMEKGRQWQIKLATVTHYANKSIQRHNATAKGSAELLQKQDSQAIIQILLLTAINDPITYVLFTAYKFISINFSPPSARFLVH